jgi:hypothetical protein
MLNSVGVMQGLETLGLIDATSYVSGLSGGAWALGSWAMNNFPSMDVLVSTQPRERERDRRDIELEKDANGRRRAEHGSSQRTTMIPS